MGAPPLVSLLVGFSDKDGDGWSFWGKSVKSSEMSTKPFLPYSPRDDGKAPAACERKAAT